MKKFKKILGILAAVVVVIMIGSNIKLTTVQTHKQEQKQLQEEQLSGDEIQEETLIETTEPQIQIAEEQTKEEPAHQEKNKKKKKEQISNKKANGEEKKKKVKK